VGFFLATLAYVNGCEKLKGKGNESIAVAGIVITIVILEFFHSRINSTTVAFILLTTILFVATFLGRNPALLASLIAMLGFNYFFLPPLRTFTISDPQNLVTWGAFTITAIIVGQLSASVKRRAEEAEKQKDEIKNLYDELQTAFEKASETEALRRSEKLKTALLDAVTHDLRTPLTSIKASITTLLDDEKNSAENFQLDEESRHEFLAVINEETDRLNDFIEGMVELARIEAGELNLRQTWSEVPEIIESALNRAEPFLKDSHINILLEEDLPLICADSKFLTEVLYNLLGNAAKYAPPKTVIEISARKSQNETVEFAVTDEGTGVAEDLREKIFDKFFRVTNPKNDEHAPNGTGLGLAIAKGIVEAHGGKIVVTDGANKTGAKFIFTIPIGDE
jgi:two-component system sensor histidine kinase KdpD